MANNPEKGKIETRGEVKPTDKRVSEKLARNIGKTALGGKK